MCIIRHASFVQGNAMANSREPKGDVLHDAGSRDKDRGEKEPLYSTRTGHMERTMFVVDLSRLKAEGDTLENALVLYRPEAHIKMQQYEQRCSQLVGMALCTMNFTGSYPEYLKLRGVGYAIRALGDHYLMGLSSRMDEPVPGVVNHLKNIHNFFQFYYHSPAHVMKSCQNDWEIFNRSMSQIFHYVLMYLAMDQHSVPAMLNPLPYLSTKHCGKKAPRLFLLASRVLRACQQHQSIAGGCIIHKSRIVTSQFEPLLTEKLALVGGGGVELNRLSILEDDIAPNKVWVLEVFLTPKELQSASSSRKDHAAFQATYTSLDTNPHLRTSALNWRFQISGSLGGNNVWSSSSGGGGGGGSGITQSSGGKSSTGRQRGHWRNKTTSLKSSKVANKFPHAIKASSTTPNLSEIATQDIDTHEDTSIDTWCNIEHPVASSTPLSRKTSGDTVQINVADGSVTYSPSKGNSPVVNRASSSSTSSVTSGNKKQQEQEVYVDAMEDFDPTALPPVGGEAVVGGGGKESRPTSTSSEGFSTPPPTPSQDKISIAFKLPSDGSSGVGESSSASFKTACDSLLKKGEDDEEEDVDGVDDKSDTLTRNTQGITVDLNDKEIEKIVNTPIEVAFDQRPISMISGGMSGSRVPAFPAQMKSWKFKERPVEESDDESDFVSSTELQEMIVESKRLNELDLAQSTRPNVAPPIPPRNPTKKFRSTSQPGETIVQHQEDIPPRPPKLQKSMEIESLTELHQTTDNGEQDETTSAIMTPDEGETPLITTPIDTREMDFAHTAINGHHVEEEDSSSECKQSNVDKVIPNGIVSTDSDEHTTPVDLTVTETTVDKKIELKTEAIVNDERMTSEATPVVNGDAPGTTQTANDEDINDPSVVKEVDTNGHTHVGETNINESATSTEIASSESSSTQAAASSEIHKDTGNKPDKGKEECDPTVPETGTNVETPLDVEEVDVVFKDETQEEKKDGSNKTEEDEIGVQALKALSPVSENLAGVLQLQEMSLPINDGSSDTEVDPPSGTVTPVEMTLNELTISQTREQRRREEEDEERSKLNNSGEYSSAPEDIELDGVSLLLASDDEEDGGTLSKNSTLSDYGTGTGNRPRSRSLLAKTMDRSRTMAAEAVPDQSLKSMCLYVQLHMNTMILLLADNGLHKDHTVLNSLWRSLLPQLLELDTGLKGDGRELQRIRNILQKKPGNYSAVINNCDRYCEVLPNTASFQYRHAVRRAHQEYSRDPSLLQISLSKEHVRIFSQCVHQRETYIQPAKSASCDALSLHGALASYAKEKTSLRQQPMGGGPKLMFC